MSLKPDLLCRGAVIGGRYELREPLGQGGMGSVWKAEHVTLQTPVAVKFIDPSLVEDEHIIARFMLEARSAAALRSTHIVQVFDFGVEDGMPYIAMEMLKGESLGDRITRSRIAAQDLAVILSEMSKAVGYAHEKKLIHRDLKPDNVFLAQDAGSQVTKVLDFGIAKISGTTTYSSSGQGAQAGALLGTPYYMSPEQARGRKDIDHRTDLWAMGVIVYEALTGKRPFEGSTLAELLTQICSSETPKINDLGEFPLLGDWMQQALSKRREERFQSARAMSEAFNQVVFGTTRPSLLDLGADAAPDPTVTPKRTGQRSVSGLTSAGLAQSIEEEIYRPPTKSGGLLGLGVLGVLTLAGAGLFLARSRDEVPVGPSVEQGVSQESRAEKRPQKAEGKTPVILAPASSQKSAEDSSGQRSPLPRDQPPPVARTAAAAEPRPAAPPPPDSKDEKPEPRSSFPKASPASAPASPAPAAPSSAAPSSAAPGSAAPEESVAEPASVPEPASAPEPEPRPKTIYDVISDRK